MGSNDTVLVENPFGDHNEETLGNYDRDSSYITFMNVIIVTQIVRIILGMVVIVVNILLIYVISKFKRLKTSVNYYIRNYAISNIIYLASGPLVHIIYGYEECLEIKIEYFGLILTLLFAFALGFDWLVTTFKPEFGLKIKIYYKFLSPVIYIICCTKFLVLSILCFTGLLMHTEYVFLLGGYIVILLFVLLLDFLNFRYKNTISSTKTVYSLTVANIIVLTWLPMLIYHFCFVVLQYDDLIFWYTAFIPEWISYSVSIIILVVLVKVDKHFRMAFAKVFRRSVRNYSGDEENLDESDDIETDPNVFYNNTTTCVKM